MPDDSSFDNETDHSSNQTCPILGQPWQSEWPSYSSSTSPGSSDSFQNTGTGFHGDAFVDRFLFDNGPSLLNPDQIGPAVDIPEPIYLSNGQDTVLWPNEEPPRLDRTPSFALPARQLPMPQVSRPRVRQTATATRSLIPTSSNAMPPTMEIANNLSEQLDLMSKRIKSPAVYICDWKGCDRSFGALPELR